MARDKISVDELLSWANRDGGTISVTLRLPGAELPAGPTVVRLARLNTELQVAAEVTLEGEAVALAFTVPQATLEPPAWSIAVQLGSDGRFRPIEARLLGPDDQPVALLAGPAPDNRMPPPAPRRAREGSAPPRAAATAHRALRRGRNLARTSLGSARRAAGRAKRKLSGRGGGGKPKRESHGRSGAHRREPTLVLHAPALRALQNAGQRPVVVLADDGSARSVAGWLRELPDTAVTVLRLRPDRSGPALDASSMAVTDLDEIERRLFPIGAPAVLLIALSTASLGTLGVDHSQLFERLFPHVHRGGAYIVFAAQTGAQAVGPAGGGFTTFQRILERGSTADGSPEEASEPQVRDGVRRVVVRPSFVLLTKHRQHGLLVREEQVRELLPAREPGTEVSILEVRPGGTLQPAATEIVHGPARAEPWPDLVEYPEMRLRHYRGDFTSQGSMVLAAESTFLPESFRWPHRARLANASVLPAGRSFSRIPRIGEVPTLEGDYYYLDCQFSGHFGHLLTEVVSRLWGWESARRQFPGLKALFHTDVRRGQHGTLERKLFTAYGVPEADLVAAEEPVRLRGVVGASPMWHNALPYYVHPDIREVWERLTAGLLGERPPAEQERIFVSRGGDLGRRRCRNQTEVEQFFADHGFHVFYPETLPLDEQVALFAGARVVAGFGGSAMFNMMHCRRLEKSVVISHNAYAARNENLFASILGGELHYFWQESDVPRRDGGATKDARRASYTFDFDMYGDELARVIKG